MRVEFDRSKAKKSFLEYCRLTTNGCYLSPPHLCLLIDKLEAVERGEISRLLVILPPAMGKSLTVAQKFPSWYLGRNPEKYVMLFTGNDTVTKDFSRVNHEDLMTFGKEIFNVTVAVDSPSWRSWNLADHQGNFTYGSVGAPLCGRGADLLIVDNPLSDGQTFSVAFRERAWNWFQSVALTRLKHKAGIVVTQSGLYPNDLGSHLLMEKTKPWEVLHIPFAAEANDPLGRTLGQPLWPEVGFDSDWMAAQRIALSPYRWEALYQGNPTLLAEPFLAGKF